MRVVTRRAFVTSAFAALSLTVFRRSATEVKTAAAWTGRVTLDGVDVSADCLSVTYRHGRAVAVTLAQRDVNGRHYVVWTSTVSGLDPSIATTTRVGTVAADLRRRLTTRFV